MQKSEAIDQLAAALSKAQAELEPARKDRKNDHFHHRYATLTSVWDACRETLAKHGLSVAQFAEPSDPGVLHLTTMLLHTSGQWLAGTETIPLAKQDPQGYGSACTYARRYGLAAMVGICTEDDDGEAAQQSSRRYSEEDRRQTREASRTPARQPAQRTQQQPESSGDAKAQPSAEWLAARDRMQALYKQAGRSLDRADLMHFLGGIAGRPVRNISDLNADDLGVVCRALEVEINSKSLEPEPPAEDGGAVPAAFR